MATKKLIVLGLSLGVCGSYAQDRLELTHGGSGCPQNSVTWTQSNLDGTTISRINLAFSEYKAQSSTPGVKRLSCSVILPVSGKPGKQMALRARVTGSGNLLPGSAQSSLSGEVFYAGSTAAPRQVTFGEVGSFSFRERLNSRRPKFGACGAGLNLRVNSALLLRNQGELNVDVMELDLIERDCN